MKYQTLGKSTLAVSEVALGCMSLKAGQPEAHKVIEKAIDYGVNFFDTADLYEFGLNEKLLARAIGAKRQDLVIATKVGNEWTPEKDGWHWNPSKDYILKAAEASLRRLNTHYIDLYQLHGGTIEDPIDETIEAFELLKQQGKIREYGISSIRPNVIREYVKRSNIVSVMMQYSLLDRRPEAACFDLLAKAGISVITRGTLAKGLLIDKPAGEYLGHSTAEVEKAQEAVTAISNQNKISKAAVATAYVLATPPVAAAVVGFRTEKQVIDLLTNAERLALSKDDQAHLAQSITRKPYTLHV